MKKLNVKKVGFCLLFLSGIFGLQAQNIDLTTPANNINNQVKAVFPIVVGIIFLVVVFTNLGHFTKENGDWKKGLFSIVLYCIVVGVVVGLYSYITGVHL